MKSGDRTDMFSVSICRSLLIEKFILGFLMSIFGNFVCRVVPLIQHLARKFLKDIYNPFEYLIDKLILIR